MRHACGQSQRGACRSEGLVARLLVQIRRVYRANAEAYGALRVWKALRREGIMVDRGRVERRPGWR